MENLDTVAITPESQGLQDDAAMRAAEETPEIPSEMVEESGADGPQEKSKGTDQFAAALNKRIEAEKRKWERDAEKSFSQKHAEDLELAGMLRKLHAGKDGKAITEALFEESVKRLAEEDGVPEAFARKMLRLELNAPAEKTAPAKQTKETPDRTDMLAQQIAEIRESEDVDMMEVIKNDDAIREKIATGEWDINRAFAHYLSSNRKKTPSTPRSGAKSAGKIDFTTMSDKEFAAYEERLQRTGRIQLE